MTGSGTHTGGDALAAWRVAHESGPISALVPFLSPDVTLSSPLTDRFSVRGIDNVLPVFEAANEVVSEVRFHRQVADGVTAALFMRGRCRGQDLEEAHLLTLDAGVITGVTLYVRPVPGLLTLMRAIGPAMVRRRGQPRLARLLAVAAAPLALAGRIGDRAAVPFADPARRTGAPAPPR
jgi:hypothetical protein